MCKNKKRAEKLHINKKKYIIEGEKGKGMLKTPKRYSYAKYKTNNVEDAKKDTVMRNMKQTMLKTPKKIQLCEI